MSDYLSDAFKARQMPAKKIRRATEAPDLAGLPLFDPHRQHEEAQANAQPALTDCPDCGKAGGHQGLCIAVLRVTRLHPFAG